MAERLRRWATVVAATGAALALVAPGAQAAPEASSDSGSYCVIVYGKASEGQNSPERFRHCSTSSIEDARSQMRAWSAHTATRNLLRPAEPARIMLWYPDANYGGKHTEIWGDDGPCDSAGYRLEPDDWWQKNLSSIWGDSNCTRATLYNRALTERSNERFITPYARGGTNLDQFNDNVGRIQAFHRS
ncbi:hypothetical protein GCM10012275_60380 [Longimycelium tulufanense]|uniref:Uncharacterized protein n=1 Tax=Longimycelium tulufanense TaxID=907463 RepID=A0A8J3FYF7_9PSEU|nr:hypothetical protein [Longimycelium tulufanense]GGM81658.1 hypothetical protein GCM10012275_60380 [Longimycelium tulufanense]